MSVDSVSSGGGDVMQIYADGMRKKSEMLEKVARINLELKMQADQNELAYKALSDFYA